MFSLPFHDLASVFISSFAICICIMYFHISASVLFSLHFEYLYPLSGSYPSLILPTISNAIAFIIPPLYALLTPTPTPKGWKEFPFLSENSEVKEVLSSLYEKKYHMEQYSHLLLYLSSPVFFPMLAVVDLEICGTFSAQDIWDVLRWRREDNSLLC